MGVPGRLADQLRTKLLLRTECFLLRSQVMELVRGGELFDVIVSNKTADMS